MPGRPVCLVLPTYNEAENLELLVPAVLAELERAAPGRHRVLVVDDDSPDGTGEIADRLAAAHAAVEVLHRPGKDGLGRAYLDGFADALAHGAELVLQMDADFSHDPADLGRLLAASETGAEVVLGSRYVPGGGVSDWGRGRRLVSALGSIYARLVLGLGVHDLTGGFKAIRREVLEAVELPELRAQGYVFQIELTYRACRAGFRVLEIPITFRDRARGESKMVPRIALEAVWLVPLLRLAARRDAVRPAPPQTGGEFSPVCSEGEATSAAPAPRAEG